jgi:hypothetical protein
MEQLASAWTQKRKDVLEIGRGARGCPERRGIERAALHDKERQTGGAAGDLEPTRGDVLVREAITCEVKDRPQKERPEPRSGRRSRGGTRRNVKRDDHRLPVLARDRSGRESPACWALPRSPSRSLFRVRLGERGGEPGAEAADPPTPLLRFPRRSTRGARSPRRARAHPDAPPPRQDASLFRNRRHARGIASLERLERKRDRLRQVHRLDTACGHAERGRDAVRPGGRPLISRSDRLSCCEQP